MLRDSLELLLWLGLAAGFIALASWASYRSYRRFLRTHRGPGSRAIPPGGHVTRLDALLNPLEAANPSRHGLLSLLNNHDAFAARSQTTALAGRSIDLMYYIWHPDVSGRLLMADLLAAADRGVRVRMLLDDVNVQGFDRNFLGLSQHPLIEVRLFNPVRNRGNGLRRMIEMGLGLSRFNRRMHGKLWIADNRTAIIGGRNIGDTYFSAPAADIRNSVDADVMLTGPQVSEVSEVFDAFWNIGLSLPIRAFWPRFNINLAAFRRRLARHTGKQVARDYLRDAIKGRDAATILTSRIQWSARVQLFADPPDKAYGSKSSPWMTDQMEEMFRAAQSDLQLVTPYFVPGDDGARLLCTMAERGVKVSVITNALAASDMILVHGAYRHYRHPLLSAGVTMHEFAPPPGDLGKRDVIHSKVFIIDRQLAMIGSLNFDLRSAFINTELGLLFEEPQILAELGAMYADLTGPANSYALRLNHGHIRWQVQRPGLPAEMGVEPEANLLWRALSWFVGRLPLQSYL